MARAGRFTVDDLFELPDWACAPRCWTAEGCSHHHPRDGTSGITANLAARLEVPLPSGAQVRRYEAVRLPSDDFPVPDLQ